MCEVIEFYSEDGYIYKGLLFRSKDSRITVIHIHGSCGNFLSFTSLLSLAETYQYNGINLLTFNLRAHDCIAEGNWRNGKFEYVGGSRMLFEQCYEDIDCAIDFCKKFSDNIYLQGHSMGCERVVSYQIQRQTGYNTILISPCDGRELQERFIFPETLEQQIFRLENDFKYEELLYDQYGVKMKKENYYIPIYKTALLSILTGMAMKVFSRKVQMQYYLNCKCICCIGEKDTLQSINPEEMFHIIKEHFKEFHSKTFNTDHEFTGAGEALGMELVTWIQKEKKN